MKNRAIKWQILAVGVLLLNITACSTSTSTRPTSHDDPFENVNRKVYGFNRVVDKVIIRPIAKTYDVIMPSPAQKGVTHFFSNLGEIPNVANDVLQGSPQWALVDTWRFILNTTVGVAGVLDVATYMGLPKHSQDFGITLAKWGYKNSAYLVLPIIGPSTVRDTIGLPANYFLSVTTYVNPERDRNLLNGLNFINIRANLIGADKLVDQAFDPYVFIRDAYLQHRAYKYTRGANDDAADSDEIDGNSKNDGSGAQIDKKK